MSEATTLADPITLMELPVFCFCNKRKKKFVGVFGDFTFVLMGFEAGFLVVSK
jgi:hypothetical protein